MKKLILLLFFLGTMIPSASAQLLYTFDPATNILTISGNGTIIEAAEVSAAIGIDRSLQRVDCSTATGITSIENQAFAECVGLNILILPASLTAIGDKVFYQCKELTFVAYLGFTEPTIARDAFYGVSSAMTLYLPNASSGFDKATWNAHRIKYGAPLPNDIVSFTEGNFKYFAGDDIVVLIGYVTTPTGVLALPNEVTHDGKEYTITSIGSRAFAGCSGLTSLTLPVWLVSVEDRAFAGCSGLTGLTLLASLTSIGDGAFSGCRSLTGLALPALLASIGDGAFSDCSGLTSLTLPTSLTSIGNSAFTGCIGLTSLSLPTSLTSIGDGVFADCGGLIDLILPVSLASIGSRTFYSCSSLIGLVLPSSLTSIGDRAFADCGKLTEITCFRATEPTMGSFAFINGPTTRTLYVPNAFTGFAANNWGDAVTIKYGEQPVEITSVEGDNTVNTYVARGELTLQGLQPGTMYVVVNASGSVVATGAATNDAASITLSQRGVYVIQMEGRAVKVVY